MKKTNIDEGTLLKGDVPQNKLPRRSFLQFAGAGVAAATLVMAGCKKESAFTVQSSHDGVDLGSGDIGILNYAYALEQLEAAFYLQVVATPYPGMSALENEWFNDISKHEVAHREFFKNALGSSAIPALEVDFSKINFGSRASVLATSKAFEDLGVSAYNGAGQLLKSADYLLLAGKIVSVEARHAAYIRDLCTCGSFANSEVIDENGLDVVRTPAEVLAIAGTYIKTKINASNLPTN
jgi:hypothetical protein